MRITSALVLFLLSACGGKASYDASSDGGSTSCPSGETCAPLCSSGGSCPRDAGSSSLSDAGAFPSGPYDGGISTGLSDASGGGASENEASAPPPVIDIADLDYDVVDAKQSLALGSLIIASDSPANALHIYAVSSGTDAVIALPTAPMAVAVDATGLLAAVAYDAHVSWVDLQTRTIKATCDVSSDASDVVLTTGGIAYIAPMTEQWVPLHIVDLTTCTETLAGTLYQRARLALHPSEQVLFVSEEGELVRCDLFESPVLCIDVADQTNGEPYDLGGGVWSSQDGSRLYTAGTGTLLVPADAGAGALTYGGAFSGILGVQSLSESVQVSRVALIPNALEYDPTDPDQDTVVRVHETSYLNFVAQYPIPFDPNSYAKEHGKFVFASKSMDALYVIAQAESVDGGVGVFSLVRVML